MTKTKTSARTSPPDSSEVASGPLEPYFPKQLGLVTAPTAPALERPRIRDLDLLPDLYMSPVRDRTAAFWSSSTGNVDDLACRIHRRARRDLGFRGTILSSVLYVAKNRDPGMVVYGSGTCVSIARTKAGRWVGIIEHVHLCGGQFTSDAPQPYIVEVPKSDAEHFETPEELIVWLHQPSGKLTLAAHVAIALAAATKEHGLGLGGQDVETC